SAEDTTTTIPVNAPIDENEPAEESSSLRMSTRKKSVAQKRTTPPSSISFSIDDPDAAHTMDITFASDDSDEDDSPHLIITGVHLLGCTTSQGVKRSGPTLEPGSPKKMKSTAGPSVGSTPADEVPADTRVSTAISVPADQHVFADKSVPADTYILAGPCVSAEDTTTTIPVNAPIDENEPAEESSS
nr:hypothetical protein [Tanacetum cinerariifolium]